jgi:type II secretory pathway pseudopilin PulG
VRPAIPHHHNDDVARRAAAPARAAAVRRAGLGLVEAMIALAITAALLTAVAAAFSASSAAINENDEFFMATQGGRVALSRILTQVRRGTVSTLSTAQQLTLITDSGKTHRYTIDLTEKVIKLTIVENSVESTHVLARTISAGTFTYETGTDYDGNPCIKRVAMTLTVEKNNNRILFSGTGTCRAVLSY